MKKVLVLAAVLLLAVALLTGCRRNNDDAAAGPGERPRVAFSFQATGLLAEGHDDQATLDWIQDSLNITINLVTVTDESRPIMAATGDLPDVFHTTTFMDDHFFDWVDQGIIRPIPRDIIARNPYVARVVDWSREVAGIARTRGGEVWFLPRPLDIDPLVTTSTTRLWYRQDWRIQFGMPELRTTDDLWEFIYRSVNEDPNGDGTPVFGLSAPGNWLMASMIIMFSGIDNDGWSLHEGEWIPNFANPRQIEGLQWLRDAFDAGLVDPEYMLSTWQHSLELLASGRAAVVPRNGADPWWLMRTSRFHSDLMGDDWNEWDSWSSGVFGIMPPLIGPNQTRTFWPPALFSNGWSIASRVTDPTLEAIVEFFNWGMMPEQITAHRHGFEGYTYEIVDGRLVRFIDPETNAPYNVHLRWPALELLGRLSWDFNNQWDLDAPETMIEHNNFRRESLRVNIPYNEAFYDEGPAFYLRMARLPAAREFMGNGVNFLADFTSIIVGNEPVPVMFENLRQNWFALGMQAAIDEATAWMAELGY